MRTPNGSFSARRLSARLVIGTALLRSSALVAFSAGQPFTLKIALASLFDAASSVAMISGDVSSVWGLLRVCISASSNRMKKAGTCRKRSSALSLWCQNCRRENEGGRFDRCAQVRQRAFARGVVVAAAGRFENVVKLESTADDRRGATRRGSGRGRRDDRSGGMIETGAGVREVFNYIDGGWVPSGGGAREP